MRVTVDLDTRNRLGIYVKTQLQLLKAYYNVRSLGVKGFESCRSADGDGYHLIAYGLPITFEQSLELRRMIGDDSTRIKFDEDPRGKPTQVLYTKKGDNLIENFTERELLRKPFWYIRSKDPINNR